MVSFINDGSLCPWKLTTLTGREYWFACESDAVKMAAFFAEQDSDLVSI